MLSRSDLHAIIDKADKAGVAVGVAGGFFFGVVAIAISHWLFKVPPLWFFLSASSLATVATSTWRYKRLAKLRSLPLEKNTLL